MDMLEARGELIEAVNDWKVSGSTRDWNRVIDGMDLVQKTAIDTLREGRRAVIEFSKVMECKLKDNDYKGGWGNDSRIWLGMRLVIEVGELYGCLIAYEEEEHDDEVGGACEYTKKRVLEECADVANYAMMIADNTSGS